MFNVDFRPGSGREGVKKKKKKDKVALHHKYPSRFVYRGTYRW